MDNTLSRMILDKALRGSLAHVDHECGHDRHHELVDLFVSEWNSALADETEER